MELITFCFFFFFLTKGPVKAIEMQIKQQGNVTLLHYNGSKITRVPLNVLSTELSMAFSPLNDYFCISFLQWSKFLRRKNLRLFYFVGTYFCGSQKKRQKSQKLEPAKI